MLRVSYFVGLERPESMLRGAVWDCNDTNESFFLAGGSVSCPVGVYPVGLWGWIRPRSWAVLTRSSLLCCPSFRRMLAMWLRTVW